MKKDKNKPMRLPRKLKKDIIKKSGRNAYFEIMRIMAMQSIMFGNQYVTIRKIHG